MPLMISISKADLAKGIPLKNGWNEFEITAAFAKPSKDQQSVNYVVTLKLENDPDGREIDHNFNSKALGMMAPFIGALSGKTIREVLDSIKQDTLQFDFESVVGKHVMGKIKHEEYQGRIMSKVEDFAAPGKVPFA